ARLLRLPQLRQPRVQGVPGRREDRLRPGYRRTAGLGLPGQARPRLPGRAFPRPEGPARRGVARVPARDERGRALHRRPAPRPRERVARGRRLGSRLQARARDGRIRGPAGDGSGQEPRAGDGLPAEGADVLGRSLMKTRAPLGLLTIVGLVATTLAPAARSYDRSRPVALIQMPYRGERNVAELSDSPAYLAQGGLPKLLEQQGWPVRTQTVALAPEEQKAYGEWNRLGLANGNLARIVAAEVKQGGFPVGLLANCSAIMG